MFMLYFDGAYHEYYHAVIYSGWTDYKDFRPGEGFWLVPGTDPEDDAYGREYRDLSQDDLDAMTIDEIADAAESDEDDETLEYMCDLFEAGEIDAAEFRRQLRSVGFSDRTISTAISLVAG
jgi:hypothetical protein